MESTSDATHGSRSGPTAGQRLREAVRITGGGTAGNQQLTAILGVILTVLLLVVGVTILRVRQLMWVHLFVGLLLIGPVIAKLASTGYRFFRYYTHDREYRRKGPPELFLRASAPFLVVTTLAVFVTGVILLFVGPADRGQLVLVHKVSFIVWGAMFALHFLGHLSEMPRSLRAVRDTYGPRGGFSPGDAGRSITVIGGLVGGLVLALILLPEFGAWMAHGALPHHLHGFHP